MAGHGIKDEKLESPLARFFLYIEKNIKSFLAIFYVLCLIAFFYEGFIHRHVHAPQDNWIGFHGVFGFISFVIAVFIGRFFLRPFVSRNEDYYD